MAVTITGYKVAPCCSWGPETGFGLAANMSTSITVVSARQYLWREWFFGLSETYEMKMLLCLRGHRCRVWECFSSKHWGDACLAPLSADILRPGSAGSGRKSRSLRDYTLLKAYDPGWMESRAEGGVEGWGRGFSRRILSDTLAPFWAPSSAQRAALQL